MGSPDLTDEYVAGLLAEDAKKASIKYSALGLEGLTSSKPPANKPKPNTRFLRNILKGTDSHNAALLAKETAESNARLQKLDTKEYRSRRIGGADIRKRQLGLIAAHLTGQPSKSKRSRDENSSSSSKRKEYSSDEDLIKRRDRGSRSERYGRLKEHSSEDEGDSKRRHRKHRSLSPERQKDASRKHRRRSRSRSPKERHYRSREQHRDRSPRHHRARSRERERSRERGDGREHKDKSRHSRDSKFTSSSRRHHNRRDEELSDSDPLEDIIGPQPPSIPLKSRGRGAISSRSGIDDRFSADYDPKLDVGMDLDDADTVVGGSNATGTDDWDQALEALRDRVKWQQQGAERLRAAGFSDAEIGRWENSVVSGEKSEQDFKWAKKGESREWDRGKVLDEDEGIVVTKPEWGRLKGT